MTPAVRDSPKVNEQTLPLVWGGELYYELTDTEVGGEEGQRDVQSHETRKSLYRFSIGHGNAVRLCPCAKP